MVNKVLWRYIPLYQQPWEIFWRVCTVLYYCYAIDAKVKQAEHLYSALHGLRPL